ncbi:hypothetical protein BP5796_03100 [Coleophoma crateriformis]|uniref:Uncharacterized protein n=1 Tax=Coleophoma crateriformis TaxID=565419 RepID=A0A3D8SMA6_9HELO|nr:hypothetical protein BP5796_03100 [Coleophoma crateriformis]
MGGLGTVRVLREFEDAGLSTIQITMPIFKGLCAYLSTLIDHGWDISEGDFDLFIFWYPEFIRLKTAGRHLDLLYHEWFYNHRAARGPGPRMILDRLVLNQIKIENPYTFLYTEACITAIAQTSSELPARPVPKACQTQIPPNTEAKALPAVPRMRSLDELCLSALEQPWYSEKGVRDYIGVRDKQELLCWLRQD